MFNSNFKIKNQIKLTRKCIKARCKFNIKKINFVYQNKKYVSKMVLIKIKMDQKIHF